MGKKRKSTRPSEKGRYVGLKIKHVIAMSRDDVEKLPINLKGVAREIRRDYGLEKVDYWKEKSWKEERKKYIGKVKPLVVENCYWYKDGPFRVPEDKVKEFKERGIIKEEVDPTGMTRFKSKENEFVDIHQNITIPVNSYDK